jgi:hypothetical protein
VGMGACRLAYCVALGGGGWEVGASRRPTRGLVRARARAPQLDE